MFVGHFGVGLAGRRATPRVSLGTWFLSVLFLDLLWPVFLLLGWEHVRVTPGITRMNPLEFTDYPYSHSLLAALVWGALFAAVHFALRRSRRAALLLGAGVVSHWVLDWLTHAKDLPLFPVSSPYAGLGLWDHPAIELPLELALYGAGVLLYLRATRPRDAAGRWGLAALLLVLLLIFLGAAFGPTPPDETTIAVSALALWLFVPWAAWVDRHRSPRTAA